MRRNSWVIVCLSLAALATPGFAAEAPPPCSSAEYRQFDFWIGRWDVASPQGQVQGSNEISRALGDCALRERWKGSQGMSGESLNSYDATRRMWHQTWVDDRGTLLTVEGGLRDSSMVMQGVRPGPGGKSVRQRITWTPKSKDEVHQHWETSSDDGATWTTAFLGVYRRAKP